MGYCHPYGYLAWIWLTSLIIRKIRPGRKSKRYRNERREEVQEHEIVSAKAGHGWDRNAPGTEQCDLDFTGRKVAEGLGQQRSFKMWMVFDGRHPLKR